MVNSRFIKWLTVEPEVVTTQLSSGEAIVVDISDYCGRVIYFWGDYDPRITRLCAGALKPGEAMLDIGANYGEIAMPRRGRSARVAPSTLSRRKRELRVICGVPPNSITSRIWPCTKSP